MRRKCRDAEGSHVYAAPLAVPGSGLVTRVWAGGLWLLHRCAAMRACLAAWALAGLLPIPAAPPARPDCGEAPPAWRAPPVWAPACDVRAVCAPPAVWQRR